MDTAPPLTQRKNSRFRPVNMLTGCPGIFAVFIFIIQFVVRKNVNWLFQKMLTRQQLTFAA
ncbi:hypothetical protein F3T97_20790 [Escherichia coli]|nr:hypothetical protein [Escherichia coli]TXQ04740.1 hypothetical protein FV295_23975 [Escherichia coli]HAJ2058883.1 hypothetical protein [Escherichia coli]